MSSSILTEGRISSEILSFGEKTFLFTGTVCRTWYQNSASTETGARDSVESVSRLDEARKFDINPYLASLWSLRTADISVIRKLNDEHCFWEQEDIEHAAELGRVDVLQFMREKGYFADERVLHTAVRYNRLSVVEYLLSINTPVDKTVIDWGFGSYIIDELKMRSMEVAISDENLAMVKLLRTVDYPFIKDSFSFGRDTENSELLMYLVEQGCSVPDGVFQESVETQDYFTLGFLIDNALLRDEWDLWGCVFDCNHDMMMFLLGKGILPTDDDVDSAICGGNFDTAKFLTTKYNCRPTSLAYMLVFESDFCDCHYLEILNWLYYDMHVSLGFVLLEEMRDHPRGSLILTGCSSVIQDWFEKRLY